MNLFKDYVEYLKDNPKGYWFKRKLYGWGWTPARPVGWIVTFLFIIIIIGLAWRIDSAGTNPTVQDSRNILIVIGLFLLVMWRTGEPLKWQWGKKKDNKN